MNEKQSAVDIMDIRLIEPEKAQFAKTGKGFVSLTLDETEYKRIALRRILPYTMPDDYISVCDKEQKEIGIIKAISEYPEEQACILREELERRYYCPRIKTILSVKEKMGYVYFEVLLEKGDKSFALKDVSKNIRRIDEKRLMLFDVDGNRYVIDDLEALDVKSRRNIEPYLF